MANPSTSIHRDETSEEAVMRGALKTFSYTVAEHSTSLASLLKFLEAVEESGILTAATAVLQAKDDILSVVLEQLTRPAATNAIQNTLSMIQTLQQVDSDHVKSVLTAFTHGLEAGHQHIKNKPEVGILDAVRALRDPATSRSMSLLLGAMKGFGESVGSA